MWTLYLWGICCDTSQAWLQGNCTPTQPGGGERNGDVILQRTPDWSSLLSSQVLTPPSCCVRVNFKSPLVLYSANCCWKPLTFVPALTHPVFAFRAGHRTKERCSIVGGRQQLGGSTEGRFVWKAGGGSPRLWGGFEPERLRWRARCCHSCQKGSCCQHKEVKKRKWPSRYLSHCFIVPLCRCRGS